MPGTNLITRPYRGDDDFWKIREFLKDLLPITPLGLAWETRRWDGRRFYDADPKHDPSWETSIRLWETAEGRLVAAAIHEGEGFPYPHTHPDYRHLEGEMLEFAEQHQTRPAKSGSGRELFVLADDHDEERQALLTARGYEKTEFIDHTRRLRLADARPEGKPLAPGYTLRQTRPEDIADCQGIADLLNAAFERDFHNAAEYQNFTRLAPCFNAELDLVAVAPDGSFAAYVGIPYEPSVGWAVYEPVCTHPDHRQKGLGKALMLEGLGRLRARGATFVTVNTGGMEAANALYNSIGFTEHVTGHYWRKTISG